MANYPKNMSLKTATGKKTKFNLDKQVVTTTDFGIMKPIECFPMVPGDEFNFEYSQFTRLMPMPVPTFGDIRSKVRAFFVPNRLLDPDWLPFISNNTIGKVDGTLSSPRIKFLNVVSLVCMFTFTHTGVMGTNDFATLVGSGQSEPSEPWDFNVYYGTTDTFYYYRFTPKGRRVYDFLQSLHIGFSLSTSSDISYSNFLRYNNLGSISVQPLLAFVKLYLDWIVPSRFVPNHPDQSYAITCDSTGFQNNFIIVFNQTSSAFFSSANGARAERLRTLFAPLYCFYENDYFTSSWQSPYGDEVERPYQTVVDGFAYELQEAEPGMVANLGSGTTPSLGLSVPSDSEPKANVPYYGLLALGALQDMVNRGKLSGSKVQDYLLATYGIKPSDAALNISTYLGCHTDTIKIGDVMAIAGTEQNALGQYGGKGIGYSSNSFKFKAEEHGYFIVTHELAVKPSYIDGMMPMFKQLDRLDFFQPEFDSLGCDALPIREFNCNFFESGSVNVNSIFGFVPRYARLKVNHDVVSGDFRVKTLNTGLESWYLSRKFPTASGNLYKQINEQFCLSTTDSPLQNLDYIFNDSTNDADHFYMIFVCRNTAYRPMLSLSDALLNNEHNKLGKFIERSTNGNVQ